MIAWKDELPDGLIRDGSSDTMSFTLDSSGEWEESKSYATVGSTVKVSGTIISPDGTWNIKVSSSQGWKKEYDNVPTGQSESFSIKTNFGSTKVTIKIRKFGRPQSIWSVNGAAGEGLQGTFKIDY